MLSAHLGLLSCAAICAACLVGLIMQPASQPVQSEVPHTRTRARTHTHTHLVASDGAGSWATAWLVRTGTAPASRAIKLVVHEASERVGCKDARTHTHTFEEKNSYYANEHAFRSKRCCREINPTCHECKRLLWYAIKCRG